MEAPTPVSALIHAATMVNAGPFLLVRLSPLIILSPYAMAFIAIIGATTAIFAGIVSLTQSDIKKILAYSTISQIGFMVMACGLGAFAVAIFHLLAHGCYKAFYFLSTGNSLRAVEQELGHDEHEHHSAEGMKVLFGGALMLALIPPFVLFSGPYENLWALAGFASASIGFKVIGLVTVFVASQYLFKGVTSLFVHGPKTYWPVSGKHSEAESAVQPRFLNGSILTGLVLATVVAGGLLILIWGGFASFLGPVVTFQGIASGKGAVGPGFSFWLVVALGVAVAGWVYAYSTHMRSGHSVSGVNWRSSRLYVRFWYKGYFFEIYDVYLLNPNHRLAHWMGRIIDTRIIDRFSHSVANYTVLFARWLWRFIDIRIIDHFIHSFAHFSVNLAGGLGRFIDIRWLERKMGQVAGQVNSTGQLLQEREFRTTQHQLLVMIFWLVAMTGLLYILV